MAHGSWFMAHGSWFMVHGPLMAHGTWPMAYDWCNYSSLQFLLSYLSIWQENTATDFIRDLMNDLPSFDTLFILLLDNTLLQFLLLKFSI
jgi:hypothetical protein